MKEIQCSADCRYLSSAREHPAAIVQRQREHDASLVMPTIRHLTERQYQLYFLLQSVIARHKPQGLTLLIDSDIAEAAGALAATFETAGRGVIYEHAPQGSPAQALAAELKTALSRLPGQGATVWDGETAIVLRAIERGAIEIRPPDGGDAGYANLIRRLLQIGAESASPSDRGPDNGALVVP
jgi:hypothetical protein